jgi:hypothetical protein
MSSTTIAALTHAAIGFALVISATVLLALHDLDSTTAMALYAGAVGLIGGSASTTLALKVPTPENASQGVKR